MDDPRAALALSRPPPIQASVADLRRMAIDQGRGPNPLPSSDPTGAVVSAAPIRGYLAPSLGPQEILNLSEDLLLIRTDWRGIPSDYLHQHRWEYDNRGWLYLHFRLDGCSEEITPDGISRSFDGECFLLSASTQPRPLGREVLGDSWRTVGIACRPQFVKRDLPVAADGLPAELRRFQAGDADIDFFFAGQLTFDMKSAVTSLLHPVVQGPMRPVYLQAKVVELMCLALDGLRHPEQQMPQGLRLTRRDVECLQSVRKMLQNCHNLPSLAEIARRVGLNRRKLAIGFKHVYGLTIGAFHRERRLSIARELLERGTITIGRAAALAGYNDAGSFSKAFRAQFGCLPSELPHPAEIALRESRK